LTSLTADVMRKDVLLAQSWLVMPAPLEDLREAELEWATRRDASPRRGDNQVREVLEHEFARRIAPRERAVVHTPARGAYVDLSERDWSPAPGHRTLLERSPGVPDRQVHEWSSNSTSRTSIPIRAQVHRQTA
jgi:hypothetical protein